MYRSILYTILNYCCVFTPERGVHGVWKSTGTIWETQVFTTTVVQKEKCWRVRCCTASGQPAACVTSYSTTQETIKNKIDNIHKNNCAVYPGCTCIKRQGCDMCMKSYMINNQAEFGQQDIKSSAGWTVCLWLKWRRGCFLVWDRNKGTFHLLKRLINNKKLITGTKQGHIKSNRYCTN